MDEIKKICTTFDETQRAEFETYLKVLASLDIKAKVIVTTIRDKYFGAKVYYKCSYIDMLAITGVVDKLSKNWTLEKSIFKDKM